MQQEIIVGVCRAIFVITAFVYIGIVLSTLHANYLLKTQMGDSRAYIVFLSIVIFTVSVAVPFAFSFMLGFFFWFLHDHNASNKALLIASMFFIAMGWLFHSFRKDIMGHLVQDPEAIVKNKS